MQLKLLREHYQSNDGIVWTPKKSFLNSDEIKEAGFFPNKWHSYKCKLCDNFHIAKIKKEDVNVN